MKNYYVKYYKNFANTYTLAWAETQAQIEQANNEGYEQITRKEAERLCVKEKEQRKDNPSFSGYADTVILPIDYNTKENDWRNDRALTQNGYVVEYSE